MAVVADPKGLKIQLDLEKGTQTVSGCNAKATNEQLYALGTAVGTLTQSPVEAIVRIEETVLIAE